MSDGRTPFPRLSYRDDQPHEVPFRAVDHDEDPDGLEGVDFIIGSGSLGRNEYWGTETEWKAEKSDLRRKERARESLGGFGFRGA